MPVTQSVEFSAAPNQTLTVRLFAAGSDTIVQTASSVTAATNRAGIYTAAFTDVAAGVYRLIATNSAGTPLATWWTDLTLTTATFPAYEMPMSLVQTTVTNSDKTGYSLTPTTGLGNQTANITGSLSGSVGSVTGSVGSISGVLFPTNFDKTEITSNGHVSAAVYSIANNSITASSIQGGAITAAKFAAGAITSTVIASDAIGAAQIAADAVTEIQGAMPDRLGYLLSILAGTISDAGTAAETYAITLNGNTFTVDYSGLDSTGNRTGATLIKT